MAGWDQVLTLRLERQHLVERTSPDRLVDVVHQMVGIHAQVMSSAELQLNARIDGLRPSDVREALWERRSIAKSWAFRGTLHLLAPDDLALFVSSAGAQESWRDPVWLRYFELTEKDVEAVISAVAALLSDRPMTRAALADAVAWRLRRPSLAEKLRSGWSTYLAPPTRCGHLVFGPSEGRNVTFVKPSAWLGRRIERRGEALDALAELIARYLAVFPGASRDMIQRWWGAQRAGLINDALARVPVDLTEVEVEGLRTWARSEDLPALEAASPFRGVRLLPGFDPFTNELPRRVESVLPVARHDAVYRTAGWISPVVLVDGRIAGTWEIDSKRSRVDVVPFGRWRRGVRSELAEEVDRVAAFLDRPLKVSIGK